MHKIALHAFIICTTALLSGGTAAAAASVPEALQRSGCWSCHGYMGQGGRDGPRIARTALDYEAFDNFVRTSTGNMPPFTQRVVPDADLRVIYEYLQAVPEGPSAEDIPLLQDVFSD